MIGRYSLALLGLFLTVFASTSIAQDNPQEMREKLMEGIGASAKVLGPMMQGKAPFDAAAAKAALEVIAKNAAEFPKYFPADSDAGNTEALPAIWENKADFDALSNKLAADAAAAAAATDQGEDAFKAAAGPVFGSCKSCHEKYRKPS